MSDLPARNRVIYQSEALFVSPDTTGHHLYYLPPESITGGWADTAAYTGDCFVKGLGESNENGGQLIFNACNGTLVTPDKENEGEFVTGTDFKFKTFAALTNNYGNTRGSNYNLNKGSINKNSAGKRTNVWYCNA